MNFYWIYHLPIWLSFILVNLIFVLGAIGGIFLFKNFVKKSWKGHDNNDQIAFYLSAVGVFYGITLGLIAAGVWQNFNDAEEKVNQEASACAAMYRDISSFPAHEATVLQFKLKKYVHYVIYKAWYLHKNGISKTNGTALLTDFQNRLYSFEPQTKREEIIFAEALSQFNKLTQLRRQRLQAVNEGMNSVVWNVIVLGAVLTLLICSLFNIKSLKLHIIMNAIIGLVIGSLIHLIIMLDNPFRGGISITPEAFEQVYNDLMK